MINARRARNRIAQTTAFWLFRFATYAILAAATYIFLDIGIKGSRTLFTTQAPFINVPFFTQGPQTLFVFDYEGKKYTLSDREFRAWKKEHPVEVEATSVAYSAGGVWPCIVGTGLLVIGSMIFALAVGICSAIYLNEYSQNTRSIRLIRIAILNLAGVPSIVFGLFGFGLFVIFFHWNVSLLAGWFTLGLMILPAIITASEEALRAVPNGLREGSLALGATAVCVGRPYAYGLALGGEAGVREVVSNVCAELDLTMGLAGCRSVAEVTRASLVSSP